MLVGEPILASPPVRSPVTVGASQLKVVPAGKIFPLPSVGVTAKLPPLHIASVCGATNGFGSTVTVTVKSGPVQVPDFGVTV